ncbi:Leucine-rich repeat protein [Handroanthus impetiginosus]|uniref:Leucine-rich repeat protein n=1 Tax=Handroanthus impetiginosus TaxID=429701 RepID=A0A2G9HM65_9LAMI|nr:Leucine-rich repeat protein [Handroanthus impetiginosus]
MLILVFVLLSALHVHVLCCNQVDRDSLLSFYQQISSPPQAPLNWSSTDCCRWEGIACSRYRDRVIHLSLPARGLSGTITPFLANLSFLSYFNLSRNHLSGPLPNRLFHALTRLQTLDLSYNTFSGLLQPPRSSESDALPSSVQTVDLSSNHFNGSIDPSFFNRASSLISFNVSNNSFIGPIPSSVCMGAPLVLILDFSVNHFNGQILHGIGGCSDLQVFRAGFNSLSGWLPHDIYSAKKLREISLPNNHFTGPINNSIVLLSNLTILELHVNELTDCSRLKTLLLRNNHFGGEISTLDFSKLQRLKAIDLGNNSFVGYIPASLCLCRSLTAVRLAYNQLVGEVPPCVASLKSLAHLSLSDNYLSNVVGALKILKHCDNLAVLFLSRCFHGEKMPDDYDLLHLNGFQNLQILTLGGCKLIGQIPSWIAKLRKLKVLNLSYNQISGPIPAWLGDMPGLFVLNLTQNFLSGELPHEIGRLPALIADNASSDLSYLALPFLFDSLQYDRLFNLPRGLKVGNNSLSGNIPAEIGQLKLLHTLDLNDNNFNGSIPDQLSRLVNLERLDMSGNHLSGEIPGSLAALHFLSSFSVANNDLEGEIPRGGQFDTFPASSFEGNPKLCGYVVQRSCPVITQVDMSTEDDEESSWYPVPFGLGYFVGFFAVSITLLFHSSCKAFLLT